MFDPWVGKIPWRRKWQSTPVLLPGKSHGWKSLVGYRVLVVLGVSKSQTQLSDFTLLNLKPVIQLLLQIWHIRERSGYHQKNSAIGIVIRCRYETS